MAKVIVAYYSESGNTEQMAQIVGKGIEAAGGEAQVCTVDDVTADDLKAEAVFALGCPALGEEELGDTVEELVAALEDGVAGKKIGLFGSYGWGDGEWMRLWVDRMQKAGAEVLGGEDAICTDAPDDEAEEKLMELGKKLASC